MTFRLMNERKLIVTVECDGIRELRPSERIHFTSTETDKFCHICGKSPTVWTDDTELWQRSTMRCL